VEIDLLYKQSADKLQVLNPYQPPAHIWKVALENLASYGALRRFCELCLEHRAVAVREAAAAMLAAAEARPEREAVGRDPVVEQPPTDVATPREPAPSVERAIVELRDLLVESISQRGGSETDRPPGGSDPYGQLVDP
jgi:hypothetical protein